MLGPVIGKNHLNDDDGGETIIIKLTKENTVFCLEFKKMVFGEAYISTPGSVLYFALVTDGGLLLVTGWTRSSGWSMVSRPGCLAGATDPSGSHRPYQIVESEKILSRMIFQSQLWLLLLLSF